MRLTVISITQNKITTKAQNRVLCICIICRCYLKLFMKFGEVVYRNTENNYNTFRFIKQVSCYISIWFSFTKNYVINTVIFFHTQKHVTNRIWYDHNSKLIYRATLKSSNIIVTTLVALNSWANIG